MASSTTMPMASTMPNSVRLFRLKPSSGHHGERADQRDRHVDHRQDHRPPVLQEEQHDDGHQDHGVAQRLEHLVDRLLDEGRRVVDDRYSTPSGNRVLSSRILRLDRLGHVQGVGAGQLEDGQGHRGLAVELADLVVLLRAQFDVGPRRAAAPPGLTRAPARRSPWPVLTMMSPNCFGSARRPSVLIVNWNCWPAGTGCWPIWPAATWTFWLLTALDHVGGGQVAGGHLLRVEPDPHAVVALAQVGHVAHAVDPLQLVLDLDRGVVATGRGRRSGRRARSG